MIKVGDKFNFEDDEWTIIDLDEYGNSLIAKTKDGQDDVFFQSTIYQIMYEQQKQRADRLEKNWDELRKFILEEEQFYVNKEMHEYKEAVHEILGKLYELEEEDE